jgi:hypothetical protein
MTRYRGEIQMFGLLVLGFLVVIGPLALFYGADSRRPDDGWNGWPHRD